MRPLNDDTLMDACDRCLVIWNRTNKDIEYTGDKGLPEEYLVVEDRDRPSTWRLRIFDESGELIMSSAVLAQMVLDNHYRGFIYPLPDRLYLLGKVKELIGQKTRRILR